MKIERDERKFDFHGIGLAIKKAREREGMTQEQLGYIVDRDPRTIMYHENDGQHPSLNAFYQMVTMFGIDLCPPCIGRTLAGAQALLYIHDQIDTARGRRHRNRLFRDRALPGDNGLDVLGIVTVPEGGCPQPGRPLLPRNKKRDCTAASMLDRVAGRLHEPEKSVKVGGAFGKSFIDGKP